MPPVKGRPRKLPHYANRGKTSSSGGELASARSCFSTVRTALGKLRITGLLAQFDIARSFPQFPRPLLLQPTILTSERGTRFGIRKAPNHVPPPHLPDDPLFLAETWRLHPSIAAFTSEQFYGGRLRSRPELERQTIVGPTPFAGSGLWFVPVEHEGNQSSSPEEVEAVRSVLDSILLEGAEWIDSKGLGRPLTLDEFLIVAPYNAQVSDLGERIRGARVGTVDKFQGQEAPIVVYSMTTSSPEEAPRGMEFLYSLNRLNVATSRARCACILVASPALFHPDCRTPRQMELANAFCRYVELARVARISSGSLTSRPQPGNGPGGGTDHCDSDSCDAPDRPSFRQECRE